jgi:hypothetical protein
MKFLLKKILPVLTGGMILAALCAACESQPSVTDQSTPIASGAGVAPTASLDVGFEQVQGKEWKLTAVLAGGTDTGFSRDKLGEEFAQFYTLRFQDGLAAGRAAPNTYRSPFEEGPAQQLSIKLAAATLMALIKEPEGLREHDYFGYLVKVYRWDIKDGKLELSAKGDGGTEVVLVYAL